MKTNYVVLTLSLLILLIVGCESATYTTSFGLQFEEARFATFGTEGELIPVDEPVFKSGDKINLVLVNVGVFEKGEDGLHWMDMELELTNQDDEILFSRKNILGESGHFEMKNGIAGYPYGTVTSPPDAPPGLYRMKVTAHDKVAGTSTSASKTFTLQ